MRRRGEGSLYQERRPGRTYWVVQQSLPDGSRVKRRYASEPEALAALKKLPSEWECRRCGAALSSRHPLEGLCMDPTSPSSFEWISKPRDSRP
jgi:hypothetical protein